MPLTPQNLPWFWRAQTSLKDSRSTYPDELLGEGPTGVLRHVDGRDDPVTLLPPQSTGALVLGPRQQCVLWRLRGVQGRCLSFLREKSERYQSGQAFTQRPLLGASVFTPIGVEEWGTLGKG